MDRVSERVSKALLRYDPLVPVAQLLKDRIQCSLLEGLDVTVHQFNPPTVEELVGVLLDDLLVVSNARPTSAYDVATVVDHVVSHAPDWTEHSAREEVVGCFLREVLQRCDIHHRLQPGHEGADLFPNAD